jgi:hypothetical protein
MNIEVNKQELDWITDGLGWLLQEASSMTHEEENAITALINRLNQYDS